MWSATPAKVGHADARATRDHSLLACHNARNSSHRHNRGSPGAGRAHGSWRCRSARAIYSATWQTALVSWPRRMSSPRTDRRHCASGNCLWDMHLANLTRANRAHRGWFQYRELTNLTGLCVTARSLWIPGLQLAHLLRWARYRAGRHCLGSR